ncbi:MAG TPA: hypothetical protein PKD09_05165 [Aggregatilinea sp.]|uniref:hypothetical protein n=1 Tax=Aggregatilinea sp. TaxID=2806333 RepID=UPI002B81DECF|nr:hypothetical protein [Aggregatilinea sp.]HML21016.1 hypothetical protein [Aggregatilinea sp.]
MTDHSFADLLTYLKQLIRDEPLVFALIPGLTMAAGLLALPQRAVVKSLRIGDTTGVGLVLQQIAYRVFVHGLLVCPQPLDFPLLIHPVRDFRVTVIPGRVHDKRPANNSRLTWVDVQPRWPFLGPFIHMDHVIAEWRIAAVELTTYSSLMFGPLRLRAQVSRVKGSKDRQHLLHHRPIRTGIFIVLAEPFHAEQFQPVFAAQQHLDHDRMVMITRQTVEFPHDDRFKLAAFSRGPHVLETLTVQAPTVLRTVLVNANDYSTLLSNHLAAHRFLVFQADLILHVRRVAGIDRIPGPFLSGHHLLLHSLIQLLYRVNFTRGTLPQTKKGPPLAHVVYCSATAS